MPDAAAASGIADADRHGAAPALTAEAIEEILGDFRGWLASLNGEAAPSATPAGPAMDLFALVSQFTALRHEVNMQTRSVRVAVEQNAEIVTRLAAQEPTHPGEELRPVAKALIDIADSLALSQRQMEKFRVTAEPLVQQPSGGFFAKLFGSAPQPDFGKLKQLVAAAADGYALSLRRVERLLPDLQLEPVDCRGEPFDPETMEAVEVVGETGQRAGTVIETVLPGYLWRGKVFRFAQVKVAR